MTILADGQLKNVAGGGRGGVKIEGTFEPAPTVILAGGDEVDLLDLALPDVGTEQLASLPIERETPWVAQAVCKDLVACAVSACLKRIARGNRILSSGS